MIIDSTKGHVEPLSKRILRPLKASPQPGLWRAGCKNRGLGTEPCGWLLIPSHSEWRLLIFIRCWGHSLQHIVVQHNLTSPHSCQYQISSDVLGTLGVVRSFFAVQFSPSYRRILGIDELAPLTAAAERASKRASLVPLQFLGLLPPQRRHFHKLPDRHR